MIKQSKKYPGLFATPAGYAFHRIADPATNQYIWLSLNPYTDKDGYLYVRTTGNKSVRIHQLVMESFGPERPSPKHVIRHLDDNKRNNAITNLRWGTHRQNCWDAIHNGTHTSVRNTLVRYMVGNQTRYRSVRKNTPAPAAHQRTA